MLVEVLATLAILLMLLAGVAAAISQVTRLQADAEKVFAESSDLRTGLNMLATDVHYAWSVDLSANNGAVSFDHDCTLADQTQAAPTRTLYINQAEGVTGVQYLLVDQGGTGQLVRVPQFGPNQGQGATLASGLVSACSGFIKEANGGITVKLTSKWDKGSPQVVIRSFFMPRGGL